MEGSSPSYNLLSRLALNGLMGGPARVRGTEAFANGAKAGINAVAGGKSAVTIQNVRFGCQRTHTVVNSEVPVSHQSCTTLLQNPP